MSLIVDILENHQRNLLDVQHVFYSNSNEPLLFVSFSGLNIKKYTSVTWFYQQPNVLAGNFLFLKDDDCYDTYSHPKFSDLIQHYKHQTGATQVIFYGPSMGGMAAIRIGLQLSADLIIAIDPILCNVPTHIMLEEIRSTKNNHSRIYLNYTFQENPTDQTWEIRPVTKMVMDELLVKFLVLVHPFQSVVHCGFVPKREYLIRILHLFGDLLVENHFEQVFSWF